MSMSDEKEMQKDALEAKSAEELISIIKETRSEAAERRVKNKELESKIEELQTSIDNVTQKEKLADGKKDEVIQDLTNKLNEAQSKVKDYESTVNKWNEYETTKREAFKKTLGENWLDSFESLPLTDLEKLSSKFQGKALLETDNGQGKKPPVNQQLEGLKKDLEVAKKANKLRDVWAIERKITELEK